MSAESALILQTKQLSKRVQEHGRERVLFAGLDLQIRKGEFVAVVGPSGIGKSSLLHILGALDPDYQGSVIVGGYDLTTLNSRQLAACRNTLIGFVFQADNLVGNLNVLENVYLPACFGAQPFNEAKALALLQQVGLAPLARSYPDSLSGGERQRVAIVRALYQEPALVLADEPTGDLDKPTAREISEMFKRLQQQGVTVIVATHDETLVAAATRILDLTQLQALGR